MKQQRLDHVLLVAVVGCVLAGAVGCAGTNKAAIRWDQPERTLRSLFGHHLGEGRGEISSFFVSPDKAAAFPLTVVVKGKKYTYGGVWHLVRLGQRWEAGVRFELDGEPMIYRVLLTKAGGKWLVEDFAKNARPLPKEPPRVYGRSEVPEWTAAAEVELDGTLNLRKEPGITGLVKHKKHTRVRETSRPTMLKRLLRTRTSRGLLGGDKGLDDAFGDLGGIKPAVDGGKKYLSLPRLNISIVAKKSTCDATSVTSVLTPLRAAFLRCFKGAAGSVELDMTIGKAGRVLRIKPRKSTFADKEVAPCLADRVKALRFEPLEARKCTARVRLSLPARK